MEQQGLENQQKVDMLFSENIEEFNRLASEGKAPDLSNCNLAGLGLRQAHLKGMNLSGAYLRGCNLEGVGLSGCNLAGASLKNARISGVLFPCDVAMEEIRASAAGKPS